VKALCWIVMSSVTALATMPDPLNANPSIVTSVVPDAMWNA